MPQKHVIIHLRRPWVKCLPLLKLAILHNWVVVNDAPISDAPIKSVTLTSGGLPHVKQYGGIDISRIQRILKLRGNAANLANVSRNAANRLAEKLHNK